MIAGWRNIHNEELHNLYSSPSIIKMIKLKRKKWVGHMAGMGTMRNAYIIGGKARVIETTRKTKMQVSGYY
jgi:hypothetical protein